MNNKLNNERIRYSELLRLAERDKGLKAHEIITKEFEDKSEEEELNHYKEIAELNIKTKKYQKIIDDIEDRMNQLEVENKELRDGKLSQDGELWLTDVVDIEKPEFTSNNLILSPVGSGKTTLIKEKLAKNAKGTVLMLVSTTNLRNDIAPVSNEVRANRADRTITTKNTKAFGEGEYEILTMTYAEFGGKLMRGREFLDNIRYIFCDEIHSLPEYDSFGKNRGLTLAIEYLFHKQNDKQIFLFTATDENLVNMKKEQPEIMNDVKTFDYRDYPNIKKYTSLFNREISDVEQIRTLLRSNDCNGDFINYGYKGLIFSKTIDSMKGIEKILIEEGFKPLVLWSVNNKDKMMNDEQLSGMKELMETGKIPEPYNFLVINGAMREGWDLKDDKVQLAILNTVSETDQIQARGRIRSNIAMMVVRVNREDYEVNKANIDVPSKYINVNLTKECKNDMCVELNIISSTGGLYKWNKVRNLIVDSGYDVSDKRIRLDGKQTRVSTITKK